MYMYSKLHYYIIFHLVATFSHNPFHFHMRVTQPHQNKSGYFNNYKETHMILILFGRTCGCWLVGWDIAGVRIHWGRNYRDHCPYCPHIYLRPWHVCCPVSCLHNIYVNVRNRRHHIHIVPAGGEFN